MKVKLLILILLIFSLGVVLVMLDTKNCKSDEKCFDKLATKCKRVKAEIVNQENLFLYEIKGKKNVENEEKCIVKVVLVKLEETAPINLRKALEGEGMLCEVPKFLLKERSLSTIEDINNFCTGPLKEVLLQISLEKLYEVIVKNIGPLSLQFSQSLRELNASS